MFCFLAAIAVLATPTFAVPPHITPNQFEGTDTDRINQAIKAAATTGAQVTIPRLNLRKNEQREVWLLDSAILLPGNVTLLLDDCRLKLSERCRDNFIRSANCGLGLTEIQPLRNIHIRGQGHPILEGADRPRATGDGAKTLGVDTYGTDAGIAGEYQKGNWQNIGILLAYVEDFSIENLVIRDSHAWAISLERCGRGAVRGVEFDANSRKLIDGARRTILNQDGLDLRMGCHDIAIENITGGSADDLIALTAIPGTRAAGSLESTAVTGNIPRGQNLDDIHHITLRNITHTRGGAHIVRLLNTSGIKMHDIAIDGVTDRAPAGRSCRAALKIGDNRERWGGVTPLGDTTRLTLRNISSHAQHAILIAGSLTDSTITDILHRGPAPEPVTLESGPSNIRNLTITNARKAP
jgi:hypothetical protein